MAISSNGDKYFSNVSLLLPFDGANNGTVFYDASPVPKNVTISGNSKISTTQSKFGGSSGYFDGSGDFLTIPYSSDFVFGSGDFTIETWIYVTAMPSVAADIVVTNGPGTNGTGLRLFPDGSVSFIWNIGGTSNSVTSTANTVTLNTWYHIVGVRNLTNTHIFVNGVLKNTLACGNGIQFDTNFGVCVGFNPTNSSWYFTGYLDSLRITKGIARYTASFTPPTTAFPTDWEDIPDPDYDNVVLLLPMDGAESSTTFVDRSKTPKTITAVGNTSIKVAQSKFGGSSGFFDGSGDYLTVPTSTDFNFPSDFTIEFYVYLSAYSAPFNGSYGAAIVARYNGFAGADKGWQVRINGTASSYDTLNIYTGVTDLYLSASFNLNTWYHVAITRSGSSLRAFVNGVQVGTTITNSDLFTQSTQNPLYIGRLNDSSYIFYLNGYIDSLRITKGTARYTSNFTVPTGPFAIGKPYVADPYASNVKLLLTGSGAHGTQCFRDESNIGNIVQAYDNITINRVNQKINGGCIYITGFPMYCYVPTAASNSNFTLTSDFTIESWIYLINYGVNRGILGHITYNNIANSGWSLTINTSGKLVFTYNIGSTAYTVTSTNSITINTWLHVAVTRAGSTISLFINGTLDATTGSNSNAFNTCSNSLYIGVDEPNLGNHFFGYLNNIRITKGTARYTANFTPSYSYLLPATDITGDLYYDNTVLTLRLDSNYIDVSPKNHTVTSSGNAGFSTSTYKYGTASLTLDGTGDYISTADSTDFVFGTGDFCLECWVRPTALKDIACIFDHKVGNPSGWYLYLDWQGKVVFYNESTYLTGTTHLATNTWTHVAVTRSSGTMMIWVNGATDCTPTTLATDFYGNAAQGLFGIGAIINLRNPASDFAGQIDNVRITKGAARYISAFTPADIESTSGSVSGPVKAYSNQSITSNGAVKFTIPVAGVIQAGFSLNASTDATKNDLEYSIQISSSKILTIVESGTVKTTLGTASDGTNFEIEYNGTTMIYKSNGAQLLTTVVPAGMVLYFSAFIEDVGLYVTGIQIGQYVEDGTPGNVSGQITANNISTYIASAAIGSAYISNLTADKISTGTLAASTSITVGTSTDGLLIDGANSYILARKSSANRAKFGNLGATYGIQGWKGATEVFRLDENGLDAKVKQAALELFGGSYHMPVILDGFWQFIGDGTTQTENIFLPIYTQGCYRIVAQITGYYENAEGTTSAACMRYGMNGVYYNKQINPSTGFVYGRRDMGTTWLTSDSADASGSTTAFTADRIDLVWDSTFDELQLQLKSRVNAPVGSKSSFTYIVWAVDNYAYPNTEY